MVQSSFDSIMQSQPPRIELTSVVIQSAARQEEEAPEEKSIDETPVGCDQFLVAVESLGEVEHLLRQHPGMLEEETLSLLNELIETGQSLARQLSLDTS